MTDLAEATLGAAVSAPERLLLALVSSVWLSSVGVCHARQRDISSIGANNLVFDLNGTLIDSVPGIETSLETAFLRARCEMPPTDLRAAMGPPIGIIVRRLEPTLTDEGSLRSSSITEIDTTLKGGVTQSALMV
jgi:hypothetical protein